MLIQEKQKNRESELVHSKNKKPFSNKLKEGFTVDVTFKKTVEESDLFSEEDKKKFIFINDEE